jgi:arginine-tRNA-protein transferase
MNRLALDSLSFFLSQPHRCSYLPQRQAVTLFADPDAEISRQQYTILSRYGFRRSGRFIYRPRCPDCSACIPVRVPVDEFRPRRAQRRTWQRNRDVTVQRTAAGFDPEQFALYRKYIEARHPDGGMNEDDPERYLEFLTSAGIDTAFYEFRVDRALLAVAVTDHLEDALSAVYTFFDPGLQARSLGVLAILWQIELAKTLGLSWTYLGYLIQECRKMAYKDEFRPLEGFIDGEWQRLP